MTQMKIHQTHPIDRETAERLTKLLPRGGGKLLVVTLDPENVRRAFVEDATLIRYGESGELEACPLTVNIDSGCLGLSKEGPEWVEPIPADEAYDEDDADDEDEDDGDGGGSVKREDPRQLRPVAIIILPDDCQADYRKVCPLALMVTRSYRSVKVSFGDGAEDLDILYINEGAIPINVESEKLGPGETMLVRGKAHIVGVSATRAEKKRLERSQEERKEADILVDTTSRMTACSAALARYFAHAGREDAREAASAYVYQNGGYGEIQRLIKKIDKKMRLDPLSQRLSERDLVRYCVSLAAGLFGTRVTGEEMPELDGTENVRILLEYLRDEEKSGALLMLLEKLDLLALI